MSNWKLSAGTAAAAGIRKLKTDALPTTAYIMLGEKCLRNCAFCAQARESSSAKKFLSRIVWRDEEEGEAIKKIGEAYLSGAIKRVCLQVVNTPESMTMIKRALTEFRNYGKIPVVVSSHFNKVSEATELFALGADRLGIALDAATPTLFAKLKGGSFEQRWQLLCDCAKVFPNKITTHLIVGLGETEKEMLERIIACHQHQITVGLFAFTPLPGTLMEDCNPPNRGSYRRLQIAHELLKCGYDSKNILTDQTKIIGFAVKDLKNVLADGKAFFTSGCQDCNRPYYNEKPREILYNYHRALSAEELETAFKESGVISE